MGHTAGWGMTRTHNPLPWTWQWNPDTWVWIFPMSPFFFFLFLLDSFLSQELIKYLPRAGHFRSSEEEMSPRSTSRGWRTGNGLTWRRGPQWICSGHRGSREKATPEASCRCASLGLSPRPWKVGCNPTDRKLWKNRTAHSFHDIIPETTSHKGRKRLEDQSSHLTFLWFDRPPGTSPCTLLSLLHPPLCKSSTIPSTSRGRLRGGKGSCGRRDFMNYRKYMTYCHENVWGRSHQVTAGNGKCQEMLAYASCGPMTGHVRNKAPASREKACSLFLTFSSSYSINHTVSRKATHRCAPIKGKFIFTKWI